MKKNQKLRLIFLIVLFILMTGAVFPATVNAQPLRQNDTVPIYVFWGDGCPHCAKALIYLENLQQKYPSVVLKAYEVYSEPDNIKIFYDISAKYGFEPSSVPTIFIGTQYLLGYSENYNQQIEDMVVQCIEQGCPDPGGGVVVDYPPVFESQIETMPPAAPTQEVATATTEPTLTSTAAATATIPVTSTPVTAATLTPFPTQTLPAAPMTGDSGGSPGKLHNLDIPLIGSVNLDHQSVLISTILIALIDGFNPCSIWVLTMLLALTLHSGSRRKILLIGLVFLTVTAAIYAMFIAGLFSVLKIVQFLGWVQFVTALVALFFAVVNIKDYFWYKEGISFTIDDEKKPGIFKRMRKIMDAGDSFWGMIGATIVLAAGVSLVEFSCTAGFPVLWVNLLTAQNISMATFIMLLLLYMLIYQLDELAIFCTALLSLKASRLEEKHGRLLKLVGGMLMLALAGVMLFDPSLMNDLSSSLLVFAAALAATLLVLLVHRLILPWFGIRIGSEAGN